MDRKVNYALEAAKEITISRVSNTTIAVTKEGGEHVADFYEAVFKKILEIAKQAETNP